MSRASRSHRPLPLSPSRGRAELERGSFTVELVVLTPVLVLFVALVLALGRFELGQEEVTAGARAGASAAAVAPSATEARVVATAAASPALESVHSCADPVVSVASSAFNAGGDVQVTVTCQVDAGDLGIPGLEGHTTVKAVQSAPIDAYRAVTP